MKRILVAAAAITFAVSVALAQHHPPITTVPRSMRQPASFVLRSPAFRAGGAIPRDYTCDGKNVSPPLAWTGVPPKTKSFALVVDDPDAPDPAAPETVWTHWVLYDIPPMTRALPRGVTAKALPSGTCQGINDFKVTGWRGPCPTQGRHRYYHKLYALDTLLPQVETPTRSSIEKAIEGHVLGTAQLMGTYGH